MNKVQIKPTETGALISTYKNNPAYGYVTLQSEEMTTDSNGWIRNSVRTALLRAETALLEKYVSKFAKGGMLDGRIVVKEFVESELPENYTSRLNKNVSYEDSIAPYIKRAGKDGVELTLGGERILRFTDYDSSGAQVDVTVAHELIGTLTASQRMEQIFEDTRFKLPTYEDLNLFSKRTIPSQIIQHKSTSAITDTTNKSDEEKKTPKDQSSFSYSFRSIIISLVVIGYVGYILIANDRIARMEGSSLWDQLMLLLAAIGIYAIYRTFKKK
jgi:hypothetical protein